MFEFKKSVITNEYIEKTRSDSGIHGPELDKAHEYLGYEIGRQIKEMKIIDPNDTTVISIERGGRFFAQGLYYALECRFDAFNPKYQDYDRPPTKHVILADSVINTGNTLLKIFNKDTDTYAAACVVNEKAVPLFADRLFPVRVSKNSFVGSNVKVQKGDKGPDTTMRLFNLL